MKKTPKEQLLEEIRIADQEAYQFFSRVRWWSSRPNLARALTCSVDWENSPQGASYWSVLWCRLNANQPLSQALEAAEECRRRA